MTNQHKRHAGIDLMRIACMFLIVLYHIQGHGGLISSKAISPANLTLFIILQSIFQAAVDGYALISGYVGYHARQRYASLIQLWLRVLFYSVGITAVIWLLSPAAVSRANIRDSFFPLLKGQYWYFTAYAGCFVLAPLVRAAIAHLSRRESTICLSSAFLVFSVFPYILRNDPFLTASGNHALWLLLLYALGTYIRRFDPFSKLSVRAISLLLLGACVLQASAGFILRPLSQLLTGKAVTQWYFICHDSPTTLVLAVLMLALFSRLSFSCSHRFFRLLVSSSFSVYLIHDHPLIRRHIIIPLGNQLAQLPSLLVIPSAFACALIIYLLCTGIDVLREKLFRTLRISELLARAESRLCAPPDES
ncbi:MAG: acyltransferase [Clostridia bacterium]|nr:acyltransferase [Clostridia bacterium]